MTGFRLTLHFVLRHALQARPTIIALFAFVSLGTLVAASLEAFVPEDAVAVLGKMSLVFFILMVDGTELLDDHVGVAKRDSM